MPETGVRAFRDANKTCELSDWLLHLKATKPRAYGKCIFLIKMLKRDGYRLGMPYSKELRDGISELRGRIGTVNYRILYGFSKGIAVLCRGVTKEAEVEDNDIDTAIARMKLVEKDQDKYTT